MACLLKHAKVISVHMYNCVSIKADIVHIIYFVFCLLKHLKVEFSSYMQGYNEHCTKCPTGLL